MSTCKKCDRCGEHYAKDFDNRKLGKLYDNGSTTKNEWDLCPDCWESFDSWIANDGSAPKNGVSDDGADANDTDAVSAEGSAGAVFVDGAQVFPPKALEHVKDSSEKLDADAASVPVSSLNETGNGDNNAACKANSETCLTGQAVDKQADSREKLEADIEWCCLPLKDQAPYLIEFIFKWLNRQAAITKAENGLERRCPGYDPTRHYCKYHAQDFGLNDRTVSRLKRENSALARDLADCERMREGLRARLSEAIGKAGEIAALGDL